MTIDVAMLQAFLLLRVAVTIVSAIVVFVWMIGYLAWLLVDHPVVLFSIFATVLFIILTICCFFVGGNAI